MMHRVITVFIPLIVASFALCGQSCFQNRLTSAIRSYDNGNYNDAVIQLNVAKKVCSDVNKKTLDDWLKKNEIRIEEQRRAAESGNTPKGKSKSLVDSLKAIVARKYKWGNGGEASQIRYIKASTTLADYYVNVNNLKAAVFYYRKVTDLTTGTDSPLGEGAGAIKEWDKTRLKLAELYKANPALEKDMNQVLSLIDDNGEITITQQDELSRFIFGKDDPILAQPSRSAALKDSNNLEYLINPIFIHSQLHGKSLFSTRRDTKKIDGLILQMNLETIAERCRNNPPLTFKVIIRAHKFDMRTQEYSNYIQEAIIKNLVELYAVSWDRMEFEIQYPDDSDGKYNGIRVWKIGFEFK